MANAQYAFLHRASVPTLAEWQEAVDGSGFDLRFACDLRYFQQPGFTPCKLMGVDTGVEIRYREAGTLFDDPNEVAEIAGDRDYCISFRWGGNSREGACAMILSYALASSFGAVISYECEHTYEDLATLRRDTESMVEAIR